MNYDEAPSWLQAANAHSVAADDYSFFDDLALSLGNAPKFIGVSLASGLNSFYNTGIAVGNVFRDKEDELEYNDTGEWISSYDEDLGKYYTENKSAADLTGFVVTSFVPGMGAVKGLHAAQKAARAAAAGHVGSNFSKATGLLAPSMEVFVKREAADLAARSASFSFAHANSLKALGAGTWQGVLEGVAFETAVAATMFKSPILEDMDAGDLLKNAMIGVTLGGVVGGVFGSAQTYFGVGRLLKNADQRAVPLAPSLAPLSSREMLASDKAVLAAEDIARLEKFPVTTDYVMRAKLAAGESGESLLPQVIENEVAKLERIRSDNIQALRNTIQETTRNMSADQVLGNLAGDIVNRMGSDDAMRLLFQAEEIVRPGNMTKLEKLAKTRVKAGEFKTFDEAMENLSESVQNLHVRLHSGNIGEQIAGPIGYHRLADDMTPAQLQKHMTRNTFKPSQKVDFREKLTPRELETRWMAARRSTTPFPKGYVFHSHDLPALEKAIRLGLDEVVVDFGDGVRTFNLADNLTAKAGGNLEEAQRALNATIIDKLRTPKTSQFTDKQGRSIQLEAKNIAGASDEPQIVISAIGPNGVVVGRLSPNMSVVKGESFADSEVIESFRRSGIATAMYNFAESITGIKLSQSGAASKSAKAFWEARNQATGPAPKLVTLKGNEIREHFMVAKGEVLISQIGHGRSSDVLEVITDIRKDFIEGAAKSGTVGANTEYAFEATKSYADEFAKFFGKPSGAVKLTDIDQMPRFAKVTYRTDELKVEDGMIVKGMELIKERQKAAKVAVDNYFAHYVGELAEVFPDIPEELLRSTWRGEGGAGLVTNAGGAYGSMASMASYIGNLVGELSKTKLGALTEEITPLAQKLLQNPDDARRLSAVNAIIANTPEHYVLDGLGENLVPYKLKQWMDAGEEGIQPEIKGPLSIPLETKELQEVVAAHIAMNDTRRIRWQELHAVQGNVDEKLEGVFRPIRPDPRDYKHVAFVKDPTIVGAGHTKMLIAKDAADLERMIREVDALGHYKVYTRQQSEEFYRARGEFEYDKTLHENYLDSDLASRGIRSEFFPATDPQKVVNQWLQSEIRAENALLRESVLVKYEKEIGELKRLAQQWDATRGSREGVRTLDEILTNPSDKNPYIGLMKSMMNITKIEEMPIWLRTANESLDGIVSRAWHSAQNVFKSAAGKGFTQEDVDHVNKIFEEVGFKSAYSIAAMEVANKAVPRGTLSTFVRTANAFLTATMLRMDVFNAVTNRVGHAVIFAPEIKAVIKDIKSGSAAAAGDLAKLSRLQIPGATDEIFSPAKLLANSYRRLHGPNAKELIAEYSKRGLVPDVADQLLKSLDTMTLTGRETVADITSKTQKIREMASKFADKAELWTGNKAVEQFNRLYAADVMKQVTEVAVKHGLMDEKAAWMYVNTFSNRINGVFRAAERPLMFQGPIGQAIGLFQSYQLNLMQQMFRNVGEGRGKTLAMMAGLQGSIFGASSLPGFNLINNNLIAMAAGNPEHYDIHSATRMVFGQKGADWLMYGIPSNVLNASLYTRGDTNPRTWHVVPNPTNPTEIPFISSFAKAFGSMKEAASKVADGTPLWEGFLSGIEHMGISRPLAGMAAVGRSITNDGMQVVSTQRNGNIAGSNDLVSWATLIRLAGAKPIDEAIVTNNYFRINAYAQADREAREALGAKLKSTLRGSGGIPEGAFADFAEKYVARGGSQTGFNQWFMNQYKNATVPQSTQMVENLNSPYARRMQEVMGGRDSLFDVGTF